MLSFFNSQLSRSLRDFRCVLGVAHNEVHFLAVPEFQSKNIHQYYIVRLYILQVA